MRCIGMSCCGALFEMIGANLKLNEIFATIASQNIRDVAIKSGGYD